MTEVTRHASTDLEIRRHARALLVRQGRDAVTLRAIARRLGITAPALYRYYDSRGDLLQHVCDDICADLATELKGHLAVVGTHDHVGKVLTVCRGFRRWAHLHPQEFTLVFATPVEETRTAGCDEDQFASVFLGILGPLMTAGAIRSQSPQAHELQPDLASSQRALAAAFVTQGIDVPPEALGPDAVYGLLTWWVRIYGHIALEVFGRFPFDGGHADELFESMLTELARDIGSVES